ncbi:MAG: hypothetical protein LBS05_02365 [Tannerellaceae bacterium]|jgi:hypothetical protein|nr:hypothetical protein [Tannerellaceae bacterium]
MKQICFFIVNNSRKLLFFLCMALSMTTIPAQVHIGSDAPPNSSAMLEVSATDKGILLPTVELSAIDDRSVIKNGETADGLIVFNTKEDAYKNLYMGLYAWNSVEGIWENLVSDQSFKDMLVSHYAIEETYTVANSTATLLMSNANTNTMLEFTAGELVVNKEGFFGGNPARFTVPKAGYYKIMCGMELTTEESSKATKASFHLLIVPPSPQQGTNTITVEATRSEISDARPLTPSIEYSGYLEKDYQLFLVASCNVANSTVRRKHLYISTF